MKKVLIVEDDRNMQELYRDMLEGEGARFSLDMTDDAVKGLEMAGKADYDIVILDVIMAPMSGEEFLANLRHADRNKDLPVLVISVVGSDDLLRMGKLGNVCFLQKPVDRKQLIETIDRMLQDRPAEGSS